MFRYIVSFVICTSVCLPLVTTAQELINPDQGVFRARIIEVQTPEERIIEGTGLVSSVQEMRVEFIEEPLLGRVASVDNEFEIDLGVGDIVYIQYFVDVDEVEWFTLFEVQRTGKLAVLLGVFGLVLIALGGMQGVRALLALAGSLLAIVYILVPLIMRGTDPILASIGVATIVLFAALFFTHGFNRRSVVAFLGTLGAVVVTGVLAWISIGYLDLTGIASEDEVYLNFNTDGMLNFRGLLLGAIIIGALGALDDIAITQVAAVRELYALNATLSMRDAFTRAMRIGKEHMSALVNTLVLAYTGASLPVLLFFLQQNSLSYILNVEVFATEIVRMLVGSIGLILAVPFTTLLAVWLLASTRGQELQEDEHVHSHHH